MASTKGPAVCEVHGDAAMDDNAEACDLCADEDVIALGIFRQLVSAIRWGDVAAQRLHRKALLAQARAAALPRRPHPPKDPVNQ